VSGSRIQNNTKLYRVFVTNKTFNGSLGGLSGADIKCQAAAARANLGGLWKAWLSDARVSASARLYHSRSPYVRMDGQIIAMNWTDLTDGTLRVPINRTEYNAPIRFLHGVYTNTYANGSRISQKLNLCTTCTCNNWFSADQADAAPAGRAEKSDSCWSFCSVYNSCDNNQPTGSHLYCVEQPLAVPVTSTPVTVSPQENRPLPRGMFGK
jgi:hypothetical protein